VAVLAWREGAAEAEADDIVDRGKRRVYVGNRATGLFSYKQKRGG
jgi:hypothetical protein